MSTSTPDPDALREKQLEAEDADDEWEEGLDERLDRDDEWRNEEREKRRRAALASNEPKPCSTCGGSGKVECKTIDGSSDDIPCPHPCPDCCADDAQGGDA